MTPEEMARRQEEALRKQLEEASKELSSFMSIERQAEEA